MGFLQEDDVSRVVGSENFDEVLLVVNRLLTQRCSIQRAGSASVDFWDCYCFQFGGLW